MKPRRIYSTARLSSPLASALVALLVTSSLHAATYFWDGGTTDPGVDGDGASNGSSGTWSTAIANWDNGAAPHIVWSGTTDTAYFGGTGTTAGTVTIGTDVTVGGITFDALSPGYSFTGAGTLRTITLGQDAAINAGGSGNFFTSNADVNWANGGFTMTVTAGNLATSQVGGVISGTGGLIVGGAGTFQLTGANTYSGTTQINGGGNLRLSGSGTLGSGGFYSNTIAIGAGGTLRYSSNVNQTLSGIIGTAATAGNVTMDGTGVLTLSNANIFTGSLTVSGGTLRANGNAGALGLGTLALNGGTLDFNHSAALAFNRATTVGGDAQIIARKNVAGAGVTYTLTTLGIGANTLTVSGGNVTSGTAGLTFSGTTTLSGAAVFNIINPGTGTGVTQLSLAAVTNGANTATLKGNGNFIQTGVWGNGAGGLTLDSTYSGIATMSQANTYSGTTTVNGGVLRLSGATALPGGIAATGGTSGLTINGGYVELANGNFLRGVGTGVDQAQITGGTSGFSALTAARIVNLGGASASVTWGNSGSFAPTTLVLNGTTANNTLDFQNPLDLDSGSRTVFVGANTATISGAISNGSLTKTGAGSLTLSSTSNAYTGATTVNAGTLNLSGSLASTVLNLGGATFNYTRTGTPTQTFTTTNINAGASSVTSTTGTLKLGAIVRSAGATLNVGSGVVTTSTPNDATGILGGWATITNNNWAVSAGDSSGITGAAPYYTTSTGLNVAANYAAKNIDVDSSPTIVGNISANTIRFASAARTLTLASGDNIINSGGILVTSAATTSSAITGGNLLGSSGGDLIVHQNSASALTISSIIKDNGTATGLTKTGTGTLVLQGAHTYTGDTFINGGTLLLGIVANTPATAASLGSGNYAGNIFIASGASLSQRTSSNQVFSGIISGGGNFSSVGSGTTTLSGANTYTGTTTVAPQAAGVGGNILSVSSFNSVFTNAALGTVHSASSSLGAPTTVANGTITVGGGVANTSTLRYTGAGETTDRVINISFNNGGSGHILTANGTGLLKFVSAFTSNGGAAVNGFLTLNGSGDAEITQPLPALPGNGATFGLAKSGTGTWTLGGNYTANATAVSAGLLRFDGDITATTVTTVSGTGGLSLQNNAVNTLTLSGALNITGIAGANKLNFDLGNGTNTTDRIIAGGATAVTTAGSAVITLNQLGGAAGRNTAGTYTLIQGTTSMDVATDFALSTTKAFGQTFALSVSGNNLNLTTTQEISATPAAFWAGGSDNWSTASNWNSTVDGGVAAAGAPDYQTNVTFSTTTPSATNLTSNLVDVDFDINSLTFNAAAGGVTIGGTKMLTIEATDANGNAAGNGITSSNSSGTNTISAKVGLAASQTWTVAGGGTLAVSGAISDFGGVYGLTKSGLGDLNLSGTNTYTGATNITAGILRLDSATALGGTSGVNITSGASLFVRSSSPTVTGTLTLNGTGATGSGALVTSTTGTTNWNGSVTLGSNSLILTGGGTALNIGGDISLSTFTLSSNAAAATAFSGSISGTGGLTKTGNGVLTLSGNTANTYNGTTTISAGTLTLAKAANIVAVAGNILVQDTATLSTTVAASNQIADSASLTIEAGGKFASGIVDTIGAVTATGGIVGGSFNIGSNSALTMSSLSLTDTIGGSTYSLAANSGSSTMTIGSGGLTMNNSVYQLHQDGTPVAHIAKMVLNGTFTSTGTSQLAIGTRGTAQLDLGASARTFDITGTMTINPTIIGTGGGINKTNTGTLTLTGTNTYTGATNVSNGALIVNGNISTSSLTTVAAGATLGGTGTIGVATINGILAPGNSIGTLTATGDVTWNANPSNAWAYELGLSAADLTLANTTGTRDLLDITGAGSDFLKGTGSGFTFDFTNTGEVGYYKLVDWIGTTNFVDTDFTATNLASGLTGSFIVDSTTSALYLNVNAIPEPSIALLSGLGALLLLRRRR